MNRRGRPRKDDIPSNQPLTIQKRHKKDVDIGILPTPTVTTVTTVMNQKGEKTPNKKGSKGPNKKGPSGPKSKRMTQKIIKSVEVGEEYKLQQDISQLLVLNLPDALTDLLKESWVPAYSSVATKTETTTATSRHVERPQYIPKRTQPQVNIPVELGMHYALFTP